MHLLPESNRREEKCRYIHLSRFIEESRESPGSQQCGLLRFRRLQPRKTGAAIPPRREIWS